MIDLEREGGASPQHPYGWTVPANFDAGFAGRNRDDQAPKEFAWFRRVKSGAMIPAQGILKIAERSNIVACRFSGRDRKNGIDPTP